MFLNSVAERHIDKKLPVFRPGDKVRVNFRVIEGSKERIQAFEGVVIVQKKGKVNATFTVRKISAGVGVERTFPKFSPLIESIDLLSQGRVRRSRLFYLRDRQGKKARIESQAMVDKTVPEEGPVAPESAS
jgi:large subunit ribosomal protein L19